MTQFLGEFECKLDAKGRMMLPMGLRKQVHPDALEKFVLNRGFESCLAMYPMNEWQAISAEINQLNQFVKKDIFQGGQCTNRGAWRKYQITNALTETYIFPLRGLKDRQYGRCTPSSLL